MSNNSFDDFATFWLTSFDVSQGVPVLLQRLLLVWEAIIIEILLLRRCLPFQQCYALLVLRWLVAVSVVLELGMVPVMTGVALGSSWVAVTS